MNIEEYTNKIQEKIGKEEAGKIADDIANILSYDNKLQKDIKDRDEEITKLQKDKEMLIEANGNLLQQVPFGKEEEFMLNLPLEKVWGIGNKTRERINSAGFYTTKAIYGASRELLISLFGKCTGKFL